MPIFLDTTGMSSLAIAVCDRCKMKRPFADLRPDGNTPGLRVCGQGCSDERDPYRLPARSTERINLRFARPDVSVDAGDNYLMTNGNNQFQISTEGNTQTPAQSGNADTIVPSPPNNTSS